MKEYNQIHLDRAVDSGMNNSNAFLQGFPGNPFARIRCQSFERICTGACGSCRKEREKFRVERLEYWKDYFKRENIQSGGDPDNLQDPMTPGQMLEAEIRIIGIQKEARFMNQYEPAMVQQAMRERAENLTRLQ